MRKSWWNEIHILEVIAVVLLACTLVMYGKAYLDVQTNTQIWYSNTSNNEAVSRAEALGLTGDFLGGVLNPVLSFFSFLALLFTLRLQRRELNATMEELRRSTIAQEHSVQLLSEQIRSQKLDAFENTFFSLLKLHNSTFEKINANDLPPAQYAEAMARGKGQEVGSILQQLMGLARSQPDLERARELLMADHNEIDHFISILFEMLNFVEQKFPGSDPAEQHFYANILKAIINQDTFEAVAMYAATNDPDSPYAAFKQLIEKYRLLEELDLRHPEHRKFAAAYAQYFQQPLMV